LEHVLSPSERIRSGDFSRHDLGPAAEWRRADTGVPRFVDELDAQDFPVLTINRDCGGSIVQPSPSGISLRPADPAGATQ
jgi:hypothetical protein